MPVMRKRTSALAVNTNAAAIFNGELHEYLERPSMVRIYAKGASNAATAIVNAPKITINLGGSVVANRQEISAQFGTTAATAPNAIKPDDLVYEGVAQAGSRLVVDYDNDTTQAVNNDTIADIH